MAIRTKIARWLSPSLLGPDQVAGLVEAEVRRAVAALPVNVSYDPKREGYRPLSGPEMRRDLVTLDQSRMQEIAYYMWDMSPMFRRLALMDKSFIFAEPITISSDDDAVKEILNRFWAENKMDLNFPERVMWLSILGEQVWPAQVNPTNGSVYLDYVDPSQVRDVYLSTVRLTEPVQVELAGTNGRTGAKFAVIREEWDPRLSSAGRLVGDCFFWSINHPPNSPRGRSDFLTLFDWIDALEQYGFNHLERAEGLLNYIWDVTLQGYNKDQIIEWLRDNRRPNPGSIRAHNESVTWSAVAPDLKSPDVAAGYNMGRSFVLGAAGRPDSWFGSGGKAYSNEAELQGQVPIMDLKERQLLCKAVLDQVLRFVVDQAVIHKRLNPAQADAGWSVSWAPISKKDAVALGNSLTQVTTSLSLAEDKGWITNRRAGETFLGLIQQLGQDFDVNQELDDAEKEKSAKNSAPNIEDYLT